MVCFRFLHPSLIVKINVKLEPGCKCDIILNLVSFEKKFKKKKKNNLNVTLFQACVGRFKIAMEMLYLLICRFVLIARPHR